MKAYIEFWLEPYIGEAALVCSDGSVVVSVFGVGCASDDVWVGTTTRKSVIVIRAPLSNVTVDVEAKVYIDLAEVIRVVRSRGVELMDSSVEVVVSEVEVSEDGGSSVEDEVVASVGSDEIEESVTVGSS